MVRDERIVTEGITNDYHALIVHSILVSEKILRTCALP